MSKSNLENRGTVPSRAKENIQLTEYLPFLFNLSNFPKGVSLDFPGEFDRFEFDREKSGEMIAAAVLSGLSGKKLPVQLKLPVDFVAAE